MYILRKSNSSPLRVLCILMPIFLLMLVRKCYEESTPPPGLRANKSHLDMLQTFHHASGTHH